MWRKAKKLRKGTFQMLEEDEEVLRRKAKECKDFKEGMRSIALQGERIRGSGSADGRSRTVVFGKREDPGVHEVPENDRPQVLGKEDPAVHGQLPSPQLQEDKALPKTTP